MRDDSTYARVHVRELEPCMSAPRLGSRLPRTAEGPMGMRGMRTARVHRPLEAAVHARAHKRPLAYALVHVRELKPCTSAPRLGSRLGLRLDLAEARAERVERV